MLDKPESDAAAQHSVEQLGVCSSGSIGTTSQFAPEVVQIATTPAESADPATALKNSAQSTPFARNERRTGPAWQFQALDAMLRAWEKAISHEELKRVASEAQVLDWDRKLLVLGTGIPLFGMAALIPACRNIGEVHVSSLDRYVDGQAVRSSPSPIVDVVDRFIYDGATPECLVFVLAHWCGSQSDRETLFGREALEDLRAWIERHGTPIVLIVPAVALESTIADDGLVDVLVLNDVKFLQGLVDTLKLAGASGDDTSTLSDQIERGEWGDTESTDGGIARIADDIIFDRERYQDTFRSNDHKLEKDRAGKVSSLFDEYVVKFSRAYATCLFLCATIQEIRQSTFLSMAHEMCLRLEPPVQPAGKKVPRIPEFPTDAIIRECEIVAREHEQRGATVDFRYRWQARSFLVKEFSASAPIAQSWLVRAMLGSLPIVAHDTEFLRSAISQVTQYMLAHDIARTTEGPAMMAFVIEVDRREALLTVEASEVAMVATRALIEGFSAQRHGAAGARARAALGVLVDVLAKIPDDDMVVVDAGSVPGDASQRRRLAEFSGRALALVDLAECSYGFGDRATSIELHGMRAIEGRWNARLRRDRYLAIVLEQDNASATRNCSSRTEARVLRARLRAFAGVGNALQKGNTSSSSVTVRFVSRVVRILMVELLIATLSISSLDDTAAPAAAADALLGDELTEVIEAIFSPHDDAYYHHPYQAEWVWLKSEADDRTVGLDGIDIGRGIQPALLAFFYWNVGALDEEAQGTLFSHWLNQLICSSDTDVAPVNSGQIPPMLLTEDGILVFGRHEPVVQARAFESFIDEVLRAARFLSLLELTRWSSAVGSDKLPSEIVRQIRRRSERIDSGRPPLLAEGLRLLEWLIDQVSRLRGAAEGCLARSVRRQACEDMTHNKMRLREFRQALKTAAAR